jgi:capsular exopolysaccharide synthesis family protein
MKALQPILRRDTMSTSSTDRPVAPTSGEAEPDRGHDHKMAEQLVGLAAYSSFAADQYRTLRHSIDRLRRDSGLQVLAVTSACPGDGKSVTALNLAGTLAQSRTARVLMIDADLRRPSVADYLGLAPGRGPGLVEAIQDPVQDWPSLVRRIDRVNLSVLPAGTPQVAPYELLNSHRLESVLAEARRAYDYVLLDTPPLVPFPDGRVLSRWVDGFLMVVAAHRTPRKLVAEALNLLDPSKLIGVVFNGDDNSRFGLAGPSGYHDYYFSPKGKPRVQRW